MEGFKIMIIELMMLQMNGFYISMYINTMALFITIKVFSGTLSKQMMSSWV